ncbi:hypothetical protein PPYR_01849 [Photinus pyralis]|uniref:Uncharacterized protein n=1 Tax=Photinus pyralis TaxID=7054 RepID=A0A5N4B5J6_PHOPY|nr:hypothetical protein PPYR_01849 [Photinus pyralis]
MFQLMSSEFNPPKRDLSVAVHPAVADRWENILKSGLDAAAVATFVQKYPPAENCTFMGVPKLNPEIEAAFTEALKGRDARLSKLQGNLGAALAAIGKGLSLCLQEGEGIHFPLPLIECLSDAGRLIADCHYQHSMARRFIATSNINKSSRATLTKAPIGDWLFGDALSERVKAAKVLERASNDLKVQKVTSTQFRSKGPSSLNSKGLSRLPDNSRRGRPNFSFRRDRQPQPMLSGTKKHPVLQQRQRWQNKSRHYR